MEDIVLVGFGGHAKSVIDAIESQNLYQIVGFTDFEYKDSYRGYSYLGNDDVLKDIFDKGVKNAHISIGYMGESYLRDRIYSTLKQIGYNFPAIVDSTAIIARDVLIEEGCFIGKKVVINSASVIRKMSIINTGSIIEHDNRINAFSHIAVGATLCGNVSIGSHCLIGAGTTVIQGCNISDGCTIGAGSVVLSDILKKTKAHGIIKG